MSDSSNSSQNISFLSILLIVSFITAQMISNIASVKIAAVFGFAVDMGTFLYPLAFTIRDLVHKRFGKAVSQKLIVIGAINTLFMSLFLYFAGKARPDTSWANNEAFIAILSPVFRISLASIAAALVSELVDTEIYHFIYVKFQHKFQWLRVAVSNGISIPLDSAIFAFIAFFGNLPMNVIFEITMFNIILKYAITLVSIPSIYIIKSDKTKQ